MCSNGNDPFTCVADNRFPEYDETYSQLPAQAQNVNGEDLVSGVSGLLLPATDQQPPEYGWTDITYLLHRYGVSWRYYIQQGTEPDCDTGAVTCTPIPQAVTTPSIWNPLPEFGDVRQDNQTGNVVARTSSSPMPRTGRCPRSRGWCRAAMTQSTRPPTSPPGRRT